MEGMGDQIKNLSPQQKEELMKNVQAQVALANMQEMLTVTKMHIKLQLFPCFQSTYLFAESHR